MNTIVCFGDSNTYGYNAADRRRLPYRQRWTGILASLLPGDRVLEEGLNGRTTALEDDLRPHRCGLQALPIVMKSHDPVDLMLLMLGTNDLKTRFSLNARDVASGMQMLVEFALSPLHLNLERQPAVLLMAPPPMNLSAIQSCDMQLEMGVQSAAESAKLAQYYRAIAERFGIPFLDVGTVGPVSELDGVHMSPAAHQALADRLAHLLPDILREGGANRT